LEQFIKDHFKESVKNLKKKNKTEIVENFNIEIQTIDYNHGLSSSSSKTTILEVAKWPRETSDEKVVNSSSSSQPPSLLSLKIPPVVDLNNKKSLNQIANPHVPKPITSSNLFPILNEPNASNSSSRSLSSLFKLLLYISGNNQYFCF
jgi:hypothetical protein